MIPKYTLCFVFHEDRILMMYRYKEPNQYHWNGLGGKIEAGETPWQAIEREIWEESRLQVEDIEFRGIVSWNQTGAMYVFTATTAQTDFIECTEGRLAWKKLHWILNSGQAVANIPLFMPQMLDSSTAPAHHAFTYNEAGHMTEHHILGLDTGHIQLDQSIHYEKTEDRHRKASAHVSQTNCE